MGHRTASDVAENTPDPRADSGIWPAGPVLAQSLARAEAQRAFLAAYESVGTVARAAEVVGIARSTHYTWLETDPDYAARWEDAQRACDESLLAEAIRRGRDGVPRGVYFQGNKVDTEINYSDNLLMFMIKGRMPQFKDRMELSGPNGAPLQVQAVRPDSLSRLTDAQLDALAALNGLAVPALAITAGTAASGPQVDGQVDDRQASEGQEDEADGPARASTTPPEPKPAALDGEVLDQDASSASSLEVGSPVDVQGEDE